MRFAALIALLVCMLPGRSGAAQAKERPYPPYNLVVVVDTEKGLIKGRALFRLPSETKNTITTGGLKIISLTLNGKPARFRSEDGLMEVAGGGDAEILYEGVFTPGEGGLPGGVISDDGVTLTGLWYPAVEGMAYFSLTALLPNGFHAISEAEEVTASNIPQGRMFSFHFPHPLRGITLAAGRYVRQKTTVNRTKIYGYFFPENASLSEDYLEYAKKYIKMYEELIGPFPFKRFSVVESSLPTGSSMPTYTLLGRSIVRLPSIVETALGHEVLHQWFGGCVYVDYERGNWAEGLTTYLSDHLHEEQAGRGAEHRKKMLLDYRNYVTPDNEHPLAEFRRRTDPPSKAIGQDKGAMLFHMLKEEVGGDAFLKAVKSFFKGNRFRAASWGELENAFWEASGKDLSWFFMQWVRRKGLPEFTIGDPRVLLLGGRQIVSFDVIQHGTPYRFKLPVTLATEKGESTRILNLTKERENFRIELDAPPQSMALDARYDLMRRLADREAPPVISGLLGSERRIVIVPEKSGEVYGTLTALLEERGFLIKKEGEVSEDDLKTSSVLSLGLDGPTIRRLFGGRLEIPGEDARTGGLALVVFKNPLNGSKVVAAAHARSKPEADSAADSIFHYGSYSFVRFNQDGKTEKTTAMSESGINVDLAFPVVGVAPGMAIGIHEIIARVMDKPVIYVGEGHPNYRDHKIQLEIIKTMHEAGRKFAIGMEMFQRPFQRPLDDYIAGRTGEKEFLRYSEYYARWKFNFHLYREILDFARTKGIPVVALNQKAEIVRKVSRGGLDALSEKEKREIPAEMDMSDERYRERLRHVFARHAGSPNRDFNNFHQAQVLWDETMAHSVADFLRENPDRQMVVLAGTGHVAFGSGIPRRVQRLIGRDYTILISSSSTDLDPEMADYVLFSRPISAPESPSLGVLLDTGGKKLVVRGFSPNSPAEQAGMKRGDVLLSLDGVVVEGIDDLKIALFDKKPGDTMDARVLRKRFILSGRELELIVRFP